MGVAARRSIAAACSVAVAAAVNVTTSMFTQRWGLPWLAGTLALVVVGGALARWLPESPVAAAGGGLDAAATLARLVQTTLDDAVGRQEITRPHPIAVRWSPTGRPVQVSGGPRPRGGQRTGDVRDLARLVHALPRRQLVVIGTPGAGKSVAVLLLARDLLRRRAPDAPVPVLLPLATWRPATSLRDWVATRIAASYPQLTKRHGPEAAAALVAEGRVMLVLDGLDELPLTLQPRAIEAVDKEVADGVPLVVTCRSKEYELAVARSGQYLTRAAVVELEPIAGTAAATYLEKSFPAGDARWNPIRARLQSKFSSPLAEALSTPLMLYLARTAYRSSSTHPGELLLFANRQAIEHHLLATYLPTVWAGEVERRGRFRARQSQRWLSWIARRMFRLESAEFTWLHVRALFTVPLAAVVAASVHAWLAKHFFGAEAATALFALTGAGCGLAAWVGWRFNGHDDPAAAPRATLRRRAVSAGIASVAVAVVVLLVLASWLSGTVGIAPSMSWRFGAVAGLGAGATTLLASSWGAYRASHAWFWLTGRLPLRLSRFLEQAHQRGVLRSSGRGYQFRHARLLAHLSGNHPPEKQQPEAPVRRRWRGHVSALVATAVVLLGCGIATPAMMALGAEKSGSLEYLEGREPTALSDSICAPDLTGMSCWEVERLAWNLPAAAITRTVFRPGYRESETRFRVSTLAVSGVFGDLGLEGCRGASVEMTVAVAGIEFARIVVVAGSETTDLMALPGGSIYGTVVTTIKRTDTEDCDVTIGWSSPGVLFDQYREIRERMT